MEKTKNNLPTDETPETDAKIIFLQLTKDGKYAEIPEINLPPDVSTFSEFGTEDEVFFYGIS